MKQVSLSGSARQNVGKKDAKAVRNSGKVPCVVYGSGKQTHFSVKHIDIEKILYSKDVYQVNLNVDGAKYSAIIQDVQQHPVTDKIVHVDFLELEDNNKVKVEIPIVIEGRSPGVLSGGRLQQVFRKLRVEAFPKDVPEVLKVDISNLKIGNSIRVKSLASDSINILNAPNAVVVSVKMARGATKEEIAEDEADAAKEAAKDK